MARARARVAAWVMVRVRVRWVYWLARLGQSAAVEVTAKDHLVHLVKGKRSEASAPTPTPLVTPTRTRTRTRTRTLSLTLALALTLTLTLTVTLSLSSTWDCMCGCILRFCRETSVAEALPWLVSWNGVRSSASLTSRSSCCLCSVLLPSTRRLGGSALGGSGESMSSC